MGALTRSIREMLDGQSTTAVIAADHGMGKTFLLGALRDEAKKLGTRVLAGRASEFEALPFGVFIHAFDDFLRTVEPSTRRALDPDTLAELARTADLARSARMSEWADTPTRTLLDLVATERPLVLILDDLHWADRASVELFGFLMRRPARSLMLLVGAYRPLQVEVELAGEVARATVDGLARYVDLHPLGWQDSGQLVGIDDREKLNRAAGGNPHFLLALAQAGTTTAAATGPALPPTIARAVTTEIDRVPPPARALARAAAVAGDPFDLDLAITAAQLAYDKGYAAVDQLVARSIIVASDVPGELSFRHPLVRQAIYDAIPPGRWLAVASDLAHHVEHAARPGDLDAVALLADAAHQAAARAPAHAVRWLRTARRLLPRPGSPGRRGGPRCG
jgi:hypothetical protein